MARKNPVCAWCGKPLTKGAVTILTWEDMPGRPAIGWHFGEGFRCEAEDPVAIKIFDRDRERLTDADLEALLAEIADRGEGDDFRHVRIVRNLWRTVPRVGPEARKGRKDHGRKT